MVVHDGMMLSDERVFASKLKNKITHFYFNRSDDEKTQQQSVMA